MKEVLTEVMLRRTSQSKIPGAVGIHQDWSPESNPQGEIGHAVPKAKIMTIGTNFNPTDNEMHNKLAYVLYKAIVAGGNGQVGFLNKRVVRRLGQYLLGLHYPRSIPRR